MSEASEVLPGDLMGSERNTEVLRLRLRMTALKIIAARIYAFLA